MTSLAQPDEEALLVPDNEERLLRDDNEQDYPSVSPVVAGTRLMILSKRIRAVRSEVINSMSFFGILHTAFSDVGFASIGSGIFLLTGVVIFVIDCYFIYCQWMLKTNHAIPFLPVSAASRDENGRPQQYSVGTLDDLLSDLPQSVWVTLYLSNFKFSLIAVVCALHSGFSILEGLFKLRA